MGRDISSRKINSWSNNILPHSCPWKLDLAILETQFIKITSSFWSLLVMLVQKW